MLVKLKQFHLKTYTGGVRAFVLGRVEICVYACIIQHYV